MTCEAFEILIILMHSSKWSQLISVSQPQKENRYIYYVYLYIQINNSWACIL